jgi:hypothetical protein
MLQHLLTPIVGFFCPQWVHHFPQVARIEREANIIGRKFGLPQFKVNWVSQSDGETEIVISALRLLFGYKRKLTFKYDTFVLTKLRTLRFILWREYLDLSFRFLMRIKAQWIEVVGDGPAIIVKIFPTGLDNYIYLFLKDSDDLYELEIGCQEEGNGWIAGRPILQPACISYGTWTDAIETLVQLIYRLSMAEPSEAMALVEKISACQQI